MENDEQKARRYFTDLVFDSLMKNTRHETLDVEKVMRQGVDGGTGIMGFEYQFNKKTYEVNLHISIQEVCSEINPDDIPL